MTRLVKNHPVEDVARRLFERWVMGSDASTKKKVVAPEAPEQGFSACLMLQPFNTVPHGVVTPSPTIKLFLLLLCDFNLPTVMNRNINICAFWWFWVTPVKGHSTPPKGLQSTWWDPLPKQISGPLIKSEWCKDDLYPNSDYREKVGGKSQLYSKQKMLRAGICELIYLIN